jgi:hypothetical protein
MLRKYIANPDAIVEYELLGIKEGFTYVEELVRIVDKRCKCYITNDLYH